MKLFARTPKKGILARTEKEKRLRSGSKRSEQAERKKNDVGKVVNQARLLLMALPKKREEKEEEPPPPPPPKKVPTRLLNPIHTHSTSHGAL